MIFVNTMFPLALRSMTPRNDQTMFKPLFNKNILAVIVISSTCFPLPVIFADEGYPVAGLVPNARPKNAPIVRTFAPVAEWRKQALTGISEPYPSSLAFLDSQGNWYSPFDRPGMTGPYDLRGWHAKGGKP